MELLLLLLQCCHSHRAMLEMTYQLPTNSCNEANLADVQAFVYSKLQSMSDTRYTFPTKFSWCYCHVTCIVMYKCYNASLRNTPLNMCLPETGGYVFSCVSLRYLFCKQYFAFKFPLLIYPMDSQCFIWFCYSACLRIRSERNIR